jgi:hypothetical protein
MLWEFDDEGRPSLTTKDSIPSLNLSNGTTPGTKAINQFDCHQPHHYLGLWNSPSLSMTKNLEALAKIAQDYSRKIFKSGLDRYEVWLAYFACLVPALTFTMAVTSFTIQQLHNLQKQAIRATLARLGFNRNIARDMVFGGSPFFGGIGLCDLVIEQGIAQLELLVRHVGACTLQGDLFLIGLSWWHLAAGFTTSLWVATDAHIPYVERSWFTSLQEFLLLVNGTVYIPPSDFIHWHPLRQQDEAIMELISTLPGISKANLERFNRC